MAASSQNDDDGMVSGINVTPLVDITLVLLIIFMVTAKIIVSQSVPLDLPKAAASQEIQLVFGVELHANGEMVVDGKKLPSEDALLPLAKEAQAKTADLRAVIRADQTVQHGRVIHALDLLKRAGITKIAFGVTPVPGDAAGTPAPAAPPTPVTP
ncbi:ExbD/TolR family protein [Polyangium aurulentum]|uniref:ExbD/TolR family protein n=1 Tax=Polyangium aurulentum TaxID=2567896 RepID=UPI0010ADF384|nr:biopolymer transporter ExbD [Polyangium aurulentum]UQA58723.1 biopolymer transporter ExbD [Polyangium aurulentum]